MLEERSLHRGIPIGIRLSMYQGRTKMMWKLLLRGAKIQRLSKAHRKKNVFAIMKMTQGVRDRAQTDKLGVVFESLITPDVNWFNLNISKSEPQTEAEAEMYKEEFDNAKRTME